MSTTNEKLEDWLQKLDNLSSQEALVEVCKNIYQNYDASELHAAENNALNRGLFQHLGRALDLVSLKGFSKSLAKVSITDISVLFNIEFDKFDSYEKVILLYGFFNSTKTLNVGQSEMFDLCLRLLMESARKSTEEEENDFLFLLSIENMTSFFKFYGVEDDIEKLYKVWSMANLYLESTMYGIRDRLLDLVEKLVKNRKFVEIVILPDALQRPWTDRNKYYILSHAFNEQKFNTFEQVSRSELFFKGLSMSLKYRHLFSPGQFLMKILLKQENSSAREEIAEIFIAGDENEKRHMIELWSCLWSASDKDEIFAHIYARSDFDVIVHSARTDSDAFGHLVLLRNVFSRQFSSTGFDTVAIDGLIKEKWHTIPDSLWFIEVQIFEIFIDNIHFGMEVTESLKFLSKFIQKRHEVHDSAFRQNLLKKLPHLLQHLTKSYQNFAPFFTFIHNIFLSGVHSDVYQRQIFSLKLFQCILSTFKNKETLKALNFDLQNEIYCKNLINLATSSDFDDVRTLSYDLISKYLDITPPMDEEIYHLPFPQFKIRLIIDDALKQQNVDNLSEYFRAALDVTENSLKQMKNDPLNAVKNEVNLFKPLDCLNEFLLNETIQLESLENDGELIELVKCVADVIINLINSKEQGLDFSKLDENLELLVEQSTVKSNLIEKDKKLLLFSFWHTLRACAELASNYGIYIIKNRQNYSKPLKRLLFCADIIINILVFCCHKGAIEAAALAMGRLFNNFTKNWIRLLQFDAEEEIESITNAFMNKVLRPLDKIQTLDIRCNRGLILLHSQVLKNDMTIGRTMRQQCIKIFIERLTNLSEKDEPNRTFLISLFLHDLSKYFSDSELTDDMVPFLEQIILINFHYIKSSHWIIRNAALTLFGSLIPKIMKQRPKFDNHADEWQYVYIHFDEFFATMPRVSDHILEALDQDNISASALVLYLEFLTNIEVRQVAGAGNAASVVVLAYRTKFWQLLSHRCDKVRRLAAICFAQFHQYSTEIPMAVLTSVPAIFTVDNENFKHGLVMAVTNLLKKLNSQYQFISWPDCEEFYGHVRDAFTTNFATDSSLISYYTRTYLLQLLLHLKFSVNDPIVRWLMFERPALNDFGIDIWISAVTKALATTPTKQILERDISLDDISMSLSMSLSEA